ncbi:energy-coupling factor transporter transmembrane component T family protein [Caldisericum exile]|uniref:Cobalt ABC transporter permease protein n=1 Tax=Caldisericum exile (strain DSM 21853 / NBRC 104410 / AZM16c01) TaxID=511051 RepID=A0A7U6GF78_CALEA|nr:energy-coupling factor transporter transmembrane component T [Caldisericum exile]BAL81236.1 putative cobalt ABC transporter permease protein [Caldisericum exile AZM16c01]
MAKFYFGQFQYTQTFFHKLNPTLKIILIFYLVIFLFFLKTIQAYLLFLSFAVFLVLLSRLSFQSVIASFKPVIFLLLFTLFFQLFFTPGMVIINFKILKITREGLNLSIYIAIRIVILTILTFLLTSTTTTTDLALGFRNVILPLKMFKFPVEELSLMISISLQFVPILFEEADRIMKAQMARGADFESGNLFVRAKSFLPVILPLILNAFNRADQLAIAMESRGFILGMKRTSYRVSRFGKNEILAIIFVVVFTVILFVMEGVYA